MATGRVAYLEDYPEEPRRPQWASFSPDKQTILFARNHNLYMMDAENFEKAQKDANDKTIVEHQLTTDGEEHYSYGGGGGRGRRTVASARSTSSGRPTRPGSRWCAATRGW
jgi:dipeptidyl-peptidase-4